MKTRKRIDRFIEDALVRFSDWLNQNDWRGKERDCINQFNTGSLMPAVNPDAAITDCSQIRIECAVPQISPSNRNAVTKDLVIWREANGATWDQDWNATYLPWVIMEWKATRRGATNRRFSDYDVDWLQRFTKEYPHVFGYVVTVDIRPEKRFVHYAQVRSGRMSKSKTLG
jgi:hypothetical protein